MHSGKRHHPGAPEDRPAERLTVHSGWVRLAFLAIAHIVKRLARVQVVADQGRLFTTRHKGPKEVTEKQQGCPHVEWRESDMQVNPHAYYMTCLRCNIRTYYENKSSVTVPKPRVRPQVNPEQATARLARPERRRTITTTTRPTYRHVSPEPLAEMEEATVRPRQAAPVRHMATVVQTRAPTQGTASSSASGLRPPAQSDGLAALTAVLQENSRAQQESQQALLLLARQNAEQQRENTLALTMVSQAVSGLRQDLASSVVHPPPMHMEGTSTAAHLHAKVELKEEPTLNVDYMPASVAISTPRDGSETLAENGFVMMAMESEIL